MYQREGIHKEGCLRDRRDVPREGQRCINQRRVMYLRRNFRIYLNDMEFQRLQKKRSIYIFFLNKKQDKKLSLLLKNYLKLLILLTNFNQIMRDFNSIYIETSLQKRIKVSEYYFILCTIIIKLPSNYKCLGKICSFYFKTKKILHVHISIYNSKIHGSTQTLNHVI